MITLGSVHIREFRGIRDLRLDLNNKTFAVWGPNGSGKSGVVDAIDFAITGSVSRLTGSGSGGVTLARHAPHVHSRDKPSEAQVELTVTSTRSGKKATLLRKVSQPKNYTLTPEIPEVREAIDQTALHPELTLARRDIIKFVAAEAGKRASEVQALLKLDRLAQTRSTLKTTQNRLSEQHRAAETQLNSTRDRLRQHLGVSTLEVPTILDIVNQARTRLDLPKLDDVRAEGGVNDGVLETSSGQTFSKASAIRDVAALTTRVSDALKDGLKGETALKEQVRAAGEAPGVSAALKQQTFWETGLDLVQDEHCPFCDQSWPNRDDLVAHVRQKLTLAEEAEQFRVSILREAGELKDSATRLRATVQPVLPIAQAYGPEGLSDSLDHWAQELQEKMSKLVHYDSVTELADWQDGQFASIPSELEAMLNTLQSTVADQPDQSATATAVSFLHIAEERLGALNLAQTEERRADTARQAANALYGRYVEAYEEQLTTLYEMVESEFSNFYRRINSDDESSFRASLKPSAGKLEMEVDFYGQGMFPPTAYHSEGHQDGMGVCLYLALLKHLLGEDFRLAILDDVVMSVDSNHRREFCALLRDEFPDVQFVITTHDQYWAMQMQNQGLINRRSQAHFFSWSVDAGPVIEQADFWDHIDSDLARDDVPAAAHKLRRNLEAIMGTLADSIGARVFYRPDANHGFGDLVSGVRSQHKSLLDKALKSARSWDDEGKTAEVSAMEEERKRAEDEVRLEAWAVNPSVHFNEYANMRVNEFRAVSGAYRRFLDQFKCSNSNCSSWVYVLPSKEVPTVLTCACKRMNINLEKRPKD